MEKLKQYYLSHKKSVLIVTFGLLVVTAIALFLTIGYINVTVTNESETKTVRMLRGQTAGYAVMKSGMEVAFDSRLSVRTDTKISSPTNITILLAKDVLVGSGGKIVKIKTALTDEEEIFDQAGIEYDETKDVYISDNYDAKIYYQLSENEKIVEADTKIKYKTVKVKDSNLQIGKTKEITKGKNGKAQTLTVLTQDGKTQNKLLLAQKTITEATNKEIRVGVKPMSISANGKTYTALTKVTVEATGYCSCSVCCGPYNGSRTADGSKTTMYHTVAAPSTYAFGTMLYIPYFDDAPNDGVFEVEDRGGAIQGNRIDVYFSSHEAALSFGRRTITMYVLK